jgi:hypothetical protein
MLLAPSLPDFSRYSSREDTVMEDWEYLAQVTAAELGFAVVRWWQDNERPQLLRIEAEHQIGTDHITVVFTTLMPEAGLPFIRVVGASREDCSRG